MGVDGSGDSRSGCIFVQAVKHGGIQLGDRKETVSTNFFKVDVERNCEFEYPTSLWDDHGSLFRIVAVDGSVVYAVGSGPLPPLDWLSKPDPADYYHKDDNRSHHYHVHHSVSCLDLGSRSGSYQWNAAPCLNCIRINPVCASLNGKIYAFKQGKQMVRPSAFGEVLDPKTRACSELNHPPDLDIPNWFLSLSPPSIDYNKSRLILFFGGYSNYVTSLQAYNPDNDDSPWECLSVQPDLRLWRLWINSSLVADAVVDGVLYFYDPIAQPDECIAAYDVSKKEWLQVGGCSSISQVVAGFRCHSLLYLGHDTLCLTSFASCTPKPGVTTLRLFVFKVSPSISGPEVCGFSQKTFELNCSRIINAIAL